MAAQLRGPTGRRTLAVVLILLAVVLLAYGLRLHNLDAFSFWTDEGLTPERSGYPIAQILRNDIVIQGVVTKDTHPPFYYLLVHLTRDLFGTTDFAFRYPSVLAGVLLVPLLYQFGRRLQSVGLGLIVALLAAVNPLQIYYSQEARMYTLIVLLGAAASYVLWRALSHPDLTRRLLWRYLILYAVLAGLTVYTHYTAIFLFAVQSLFWAWLLWREGLRWVIIAAVGAAVLLAIPLVPYTVPRLFTGAEANYSYVPPQVMLQDVVHFFTSGLTTNFSLLSTRLFDLLALALVLVGLWAARTWQKRLFLLSWLLAVVFGLMAGSLVKPMYQGVRHIMLGSPAWIILVGYGIWALLRWAPFAAGETVRRRRLNPVGLLALALVVGGAAVALNNLYANPDYAKDNFRAMIRFIEQRAGDRDVLVYNNAVLLPLHEHYRQRDDIAVTALPGYPQMATGSEPELTTLATHYDRIWFITDPPADGRDDDQLIQRWLEANQTELINRLFPARTTVARVLAFDTGAAVARPTTPLEQPVGWDGWPALTSATVTTAQPVALPALWADLVWQGEAPPPDARLRLALHDANGREAALSGQPLVRDETAVWDPLGGNRFSYGLPLPAGLASGRYTLTVQPEDGGGNPLGDPVPVAPVSLAGTSAWPAPPIALADPTDPDNAAYGPPAIRWDNGLNLQAAVAWDETVRPGNNLPLTLFWSAGKTAVPTTNLRYRLAVMDAQGNEVRWQAEPPGAPWLAEIPAGDLVREVTSLYFDPATEPGLYHLQWQLLDGETVIDGRAPWWPLSRQTIDHGTVRVVPWPLETQAPTSAPEIGASFGPAIDLSHYERFPPADGTLPLTLYWQANAQPDTGYLVFLHLVSEATGEIVSQLDRIPVDGLRPTTGWRRGELLTDSYTLPLPDDLPAGRYHLNVGLYNPDDGTRPPVTIDGVDQPGDQLRLLSFDWPPTN